MSNLPDSLERAYRHHQAGELRQAEALYRQILASNPNQPDTLHLLGLVAFQTSHYSQAIDLIRQAIASGGPQAMFYVNLGESQRAAGELAAAEQSLRQALELDPTLADVPNCLGNLLRQCGRNDEAIRYFQRAVELRPDFADAHNNLGTALHVAANLPAAIASYRRAIELDPKHVGAASNLGLALQAQGNLAHAIEAYEQALRLDTAKSEVHVNLGTAYQQQGKADQAADCYREALRLNPGSVAALNNLSSALIALGRIDEAIVQGQRALELQPDGVDAHFNLGVANLAVGRRGEAGEQFREVLRLRPDHVRAMANLAYVLEQQGELDEALALCEAATTLRSDFVDAHLHRASVLRLKKMAPEAVQAFRKVLELVPNHAQALNGLAIVYLETGHTDEAVACCRQGLAHAPRLAALHANLSTAMQNLGRIDEAIGHVRQAVELNPADPVAHSNLLYQLNFRPGYSQAEIFAEHRAWAQRHAEPLTGRAAAPANDRTAERRLRVGYVSPYFRDHAVNFFVEPVIAAHDRSQVEVFCYSDAAHPDQATRRLKSSADYWRDTFGRSDEQLAQMVRDDAIDVLVDLTGHIAGSRLLAFARRPAPVQVTWLGYQNTTGMSAINYRLTDERADPPGLTDAFYTELLVRLPHAFFCYRPADEAPPVGTLPALARGAVTFGSFNNFFKVTPQVLETWLDILRQVEGSRLVLLANPAASLRASLDELARARGIDPARIELVAKRPRREYFELLSSVDVALDPFPFNGHTTTCDSIWMGVPVVMIAGASYSSRFGGSVLANLGLDGLIAGSREAYVHAAIELASDLARLAQLRGELRQRMADSPLLDFAGFTRNLEAAYRQMWLSWCGQ